MICLQGWTAGQLSNPKFDWVKNINKKLQQKDIDTHYEEVSSVFAMCWNLARQKFPSPIIEDFEKFLTIVNPPRMQYNMSVPGFSLSIDGHTHQFHQQPFAPPSGQTTSNYARYIHTESNGTRYMFLWFTGRECSEGSQSESVNCGGNFFLADYGVRVQAARDTSIVWEPRNAHGTSLMEKDERFLQTGLSMGISKRLASVWQKYKDGLDLDGNMDKEVEEVFAREEEHDIDMVEEGEIVE